MTRLPSVSVVINTLNREEALRTTLNSLRWQRGEIDFEVVVVNGPSTDGTASLLLEWGSALKVASCDVANLSVSRNMGIETASGDIVAFLDDDAIPERDWLLQIASAYDADDVGAAGGLTFDYTGFAFQDEYVLVNRLGETDKSRTTATPHLAFPGSRLIPHLLGCNCSFKRSALLEIGGFDEEFEYYLDESDVCIRLVDAGYRVVQVDGAYVHHKSAPSNLRGRNRVPGQRYPILKNKLYFSLKHGTGFYRPSEIFDDYQRFVQKHRQEVAWAEGEGLLPEGSSLALQEQLDRALERGLLASHEPKAPRVFPETPGPECNFKSFPVEVADRALCVALICRGYPPSGTGGIATFTQDLAEALAARGHCVHVIAESPDVERVDFEDGVWTHRVHLDYSGTAPVMGAVKVPEGIWAWSLAARREVERLASRHPIDIVEAPIWDVEGVAFIDGPWPLVTSLHTSLAFYLDAHPEYIDDPAWMDDFGSPMLEIERLVVRSADAVRANSRAITTDIQQRYQVLIDSTRLAVIPHGLRDSSPTVAGDAAPGDEILFVGRLERRKGIDTLLEAIPMVLSEVPTARFRIVGEDVPSKNGGYEAAFRERHQDKADISERVVFEGWLPVDQLLEAYRRCAVFVAPSRYESFGLVFVEAMREAKPVVGCAVGGVPEVVDNGLTGLLVPPDDPQALAHGLVALATSRSRREEMGKQGRAAFEARFTSSRMAEASERLYRAAAKRVGRQHAN